MWYREVLSVRRSVLMFAIVVAVLGAFNAWGAGDSGGIILSEALDLACFATIVLTLVVGTNLGRELGTLAGAVLMRPAPRERYACTVFAVDLIALALAYLAASVAVVGPYEIAHGLAPMDARGVTMLTAIVLPLCAVFAFYGLTVACGVASRGALGAAILVGPVCLALWVGAAIYAWPITWLFRIVCVANPLIYLASAVNAIERAAHPALVSSTHDSSFYAGLTVGTDATILFAIGAVALLLATLLWKRAEV
jgi:hypothetical protein